MEKPIKFWPVISELGLGSKCQIPPNIPPWERENYKDFWALREAAALSAIAYLGLAEPLRVKPTELSKAVMPFFEPKPPRRSCEKFVEEVVPQALGSLTEVGIPSIMAVCAFGILRIIWPDDFNCAQLRLTALGAILQDSAANEIYKNYSGYFDPTFVLPKPDNTGNCSWKSLLKGPKK